MPMSIQPSCCSAPAISARPHPVSGPGCPLGLRVLNKIEAIIREEINGIGAQEVHFPALLPREPYEATHRWEEYGDIHLPGSQRFGHEADDLLAPTHEETFDPSGQGHVLLLQGPARHPCTRSRPSTATSSVRAPA